MGNQQANSADYGGIYVQLDKEVIVPNECVSGTVQLQVKKDYPADDLFFKINGFERVHCIQTIQKQRQKPDGTFETYYEYIPRKAERSFIDTQIKIFDWVGNGFVRPGQYSFPFQFLVPDGLPGSFYLKRNKAFGEIAYRLMVYIKPTPNNIPQIQYRLNTQVREPVKKNVSTGESSINADLTCYCCVKNGTMNMTTYFEKNAYAPEEECKIATDIDCSQSSIDISNVSFNLTQHVTLHAQEYTHSLTIPIKSLSLGTIKAGEKWVGEQRKFASLEVPPQDSRNPDQFDEVSDDIMNYMPPYSNTIVPSANGKLISSNFTLSVSAVPSGCNCCGPTPTTSIPVQIYAGALKQKPEPVTAPPGWNPQVMQPMNLVITIRQRPDGGQDIVIDMPTQMPPNTQQPMMQNSMPQQQMQQSQPIQQQQQIQQQPQFQQQQFQQQPMQMQPQQQFIQPQQQFQQA